MHSNEKKMVEIRRSPLALLLGLFYLFVAVVFAIAARKALAEPPFWNDWMLVLEYRKLVAQYLVEGFGIPAVWIAGALGLIALMVGFVALQHLLTELSSRYNVTSLRVSTQAGVFGVRRDELYLISIDGVSMHQTLFARLFGYATLVIAGRGNNTLSMTFVRQPKQVKEKLDRVVLARRAKQADE